MGLKSITNISFIMVVITITILFPQTKSQVCSETCNNKKYICGKGSAFLNKRINEEQQIEKVKNIARDEFSRTIRTEIESKTKMVITENNEGFEETFVMISNFSTRYTAQGLSVEAYICDGKVKAQARQEISRVYKDIQAKNEENYAQAKQYLDEAKLIDTYEEKLTKLFLAYIYNKAQIEAIYKGDKKYKKLFPEISSEIENISKSLKIEIANKPASLRYDESSRQSQIKIKINTGPSSKLKIPILALSAELNKGLINTFEDYWADDRTANILIENRQGTISVDQVISSQKIEIELKINLEPYDPDDYIYDELGYPRSNRTNPSDVFQNVFYDKNKKIKIPITNGPKNPLKGIITINTPGLKDELIVKINGNKAGTTKNERFRSSPLAYSYYTIELLSPINAKDYIIPEKEIVKLIDRDLKVTISGIKKMKGTLEFIPTDEDERINIRIKEKGTNSPLNVKFNYMGRILTTGFPSNLEYINQNKIRLNSGIYDIFLTKEGEQTTSIYNKNLGFAGANRQIKLQIEKPPLNKKMLEYVPFTKPFICNQSDRSKLIKTSLLALATFMTSQKFNDYTEKRDIYFSHKEEYEALRDAEQSVFDTKRSEMNSAYNEFNSAYSTLNYLYAGLGITYVYTILF